MLHCGWAIQPQACYNGFIMQKITIPVSKPRNPLVVLARGRKAGSHGTRRDVMERALRREARKNYE